MLLRADALEEVGNHMVFRVSSWHSA